jgi:hypothetical protein
MVMVVERSLELKAAPRHLYHAIWVMLIIGLFCSAMSLFARLKMKYYIGKKLYAEDCEHIPPFGRLHPSGYSAGEFLMTQNLPYTNRTQLLVCLAAAWVQSRNSSISMPNMLTLKTGTLRGNAGPNPL